MTSNNTGSGTYTETFVVTNPAGQPVESMILSGAVTLTRNSGTTTSHGIAARI